MSSLAIACVLFAWQVLTIEFNALPISSGTMTKISVILTMMMSKSECVCVCV